MVKESDANGKCYRLIERGTLLSTIPASTVAVPSHSSPPPNPDPILRISHIYIYLYLVYIIGASNILMKSVSITHCILVMLTLTCNLLFLLQRTCHYLKFINIFFLYLNIPVI